jgi:uncharacterized membrane protein YcfT
VAVSWLLVVAGSVFGAMVGIIAAGGALMYLIPAEGCDSECWQNDTLMRVLGFAGVPLGLATAVVVPVARWIGRTWPRMAALIVAGVAVSMIAWWNVTNHLLDSAVPT